MRKVIVILIMVCPWINAQAQTNMVRNPSFETHWRCPQYHDLVKYANYWTSINDTVVSINDTLGSFPFYGCLPEYCNACSDFYKVNVPSHWFYTQYPRTGNGMMHVTMYYSATDPTYVNQRDYLQGRLKNVLSSGQEYCVTFYVVSAECSPYAIDKIGAYFDDGSVDTATNCGYPQSNYVPQVYTNTIINDTVHWIKIQGTFTAGANQRFVTIGNFFDADHTDTLGVGHSLLPGNFSTRYLVDDVSVLKIGTIANAGNDTTIYTGDTAWIGEHVGYTGDSTWNNDYDDYAPVKWYTATGTLIDSNHASLHVHPTTTASYVMELDVCGTLSYDTVTVHVHGLGIGGIGMANVKVYPNPASDEVHVSGVDAGAAYRLLNAVGVVVQSGSLQHKDNRISLVGLAAGIYVLEVTDANKAKANCRIIKLQ